MENDRQQSRIRKFGDEYGDESSTALRTSTWQAAGAGDGAQDEQSFGYMQEYQYPPRQVHRSPSQYQLAYLQGPISQEQFPQYTSRMAFEAPAQPLYDEMPSYRSQPTATEVISRQFSFPQSSSAGNERRVSGFGKISQRYSTALYQQSRQYNHTTDLEHSTLASSDPSAEPEQAAGAEPTNQTATGNL